jgi:hypothetical protein
VDQRNPYRPPAAQAADRIAANGKLAGRFERSPAAIVDTVMPLISLPMMAVGGCIEQAVCGPRKRRPAACDDEVRRAMTCGASRTKALRLR